MQLLHADVTVFKTLDHIKAYIYIVQDNFSRAILNYTVSLECKAQTMMEMIRGVHGRYLKPAAIPDCQLMTDDGSENYGAVKDLIHSSENPVLQHIIAQKDIEYSNSKVEAAYNNKNTVFSITKTFQILKRSTNIFHRPLKIITSDHMPCLMV